MASPEVLDFAQLLAPISGDNPAGRPLREDFAPSSVYYAIKDARAKARETERRVVYEDEEGATAVTAADWRPILELAPKAIAEESKDLEITAFLIEALVRQHGYAGLRDGLRLARELIENFWDHLYPLPDEEGVTTRVVPLTGLNGNESDSLLAGPISTVPITEGKSFGPFTLAEYRQAIEVDQIEDPEKRASRLEQPGAVSKAIFDTAVSETPPEFFRNLLEDVAACAQEFQKLCDVLEERCGEDDSGYSLAPPSSNIRNALENCRHDVVNVCRHLLEPDEIDEAEGGEMIEAAAAEGGSISQVHTREEAFRALLRAADFFKRTEPHSPVSYALEQAVRWGRMALPDLLAELIPDETTRNELYNRVGIRLPEEPE